MKQLRYHFDRLILWYLGGIFAITFVGSYFGLIYLFAALTHLIMIFMVVRITNVSSQTGPRAWLRWLYPLLLLLPLHYEIELVASVFHGGVVFDDVVKVWDRWLFGGHPHRYLADQLPGPLWREFFHLMYITYFIIVIGGYLYARRRGQVSEERGERDVPSDFPRYAFVFLGTFLTYMLIFILFPVTGPLDDRFLRFEGYGFLGPLIDLLYAAGDSAGGAFPSSHIGEAVVVYLLLRPRSPVIRTISIALITGLTVSTVYGSFHYAIDAVAGLLTGILFYIFWNWFYGRLKKEPVANEEASGSQVQSEV
ncbi:MAG: phosphatase PAP2 family protein [Fidelibacterota bacterium]|nr:MAG: phosphatase PAP2 family protein [Candidatus Neomarinimicrobiota bacterium]